MDCANCRVKFNSNVKKKLISAQVIFLFWQRSEHHTVAWFITTAVVGNMY